MTGWFDYKGITTQQHSNIREPFEKLFKEVNPKRILEIGTAYGGLTLFLRDLLDEIGKNETKFVSYDIVDKHYLHERLENGLNVDVRIEEIFNDAYNELKNPEELKSFIQQDGTTIVLCDGGYKINEFSIFSDFLKDGDIIMAHDYSPDKDYFEEHVREQIWAWLEIVDSDIESACLRNNLKPFLHEDFKNVVLVCKQKN